MAGKPQLEIEKQNSKQEYITERDGTIYCCATCHYKNNVKVERFTTCWKLGYKRPIQVDDVLGRDGEVARMMSPVSKILNVHIKLEEEKDYGDGKKKFLLYCRFCGDVAGVAIREGGMDGFEDLRFFVHKSTVYKT